MTEKYKAELWYERDPKLSNEDIWNDLKNAGILVFNKEVKGEPKRKAEKLYREYMKSDFKARKRWKQKYIAGVPAGKPTKTTVYLDKTTGREVHPSVRKRLLASGSVDTGQVKWVPNIKMGIVKHGDLICISGVVYDRGEGGEMWSEPKTSIGKKVYEDLKAGTHFNARPTGQTKVTDYE